MTCVICVGIHLGGGVVWELGERFGTLTAVVVSGIGSLAGVYAGWWVARKYLA